MKANENKIKDGENSKSDLISFSSNLKIFSTKNFHLFLYFVTAYILRGIFRLAEVLKACQEGIPLHGEC